MQLITTRNPQGYRLQGERGDPSRPWLGVALAPDGKRVGAYLRPLRSDATLAQLTAIAKKLLEFRHPSVAPLQDLGLVEHNAVLIYGDLPGTPLLATLAERLPLPETAACLVLYDILAPLASLQGAGLHHGDLLPERIVLRADRSIGLLAPVPESLDLYGHPATCFPPAALRTVAPERLAAVPCNLVAGDVYAVGRLLLDLLSAPVEDEAAPSTSEDPLLCLERLLPQASPRLTTILRCCLNRDPKQRYGNPNELRHDLNLFLTDCDPELAPRIRAGGQRAGSTPIAGVSRQLTPSGPALHEYVQGRSQAAATIQADTASGAISEGNVRRAARLISLAGDGMRAWIKLAAGVRFPEELLRRTLEQEGVVFGIQEGGLIQATTPRNEVRRITLALGQTAGPGRAGRTVLGRVLPGLARKILLQVTEDKASALAILAPGTIPTYQEIEQACQQAGVVHGLDKELIDKLVDQGSTEEEVVLARADAMVPARAAGFRLLGAPDEVRLVAEGDLIATWHEAEPGRDGRDVHGETMPATEADAVERTLLIGPGTREQQRGDRGVLLASRPGLVRQSAAGVVSVAAVEIITGDLVAQAGPKVVDAVLIVRGSIRDGAVVECADDLIVDGDIGDARLSVGGLLLVGGAIRDGMTEIAVAGGVRAAAIGKRRVVASDVTVAGAMRGSEIIATGVVQAVQVIGGSITAYGRLRAEHIGDIDGTDTLVWAGRHVPRALARDLARMDARRVGVERELLLREARIFERLLRELGKRQAFQEASGYMRGDYRNDLAGRIVRVKERLALVREQLDGKRGELLDKRQNAESANAGVDDWAGEVEVIGTLHAGVRLKIAEAATRRIERKQDKVVVRL